MTLTPTALLVLLACGAGTGVIGAILGTGGGVFLVPLLVLALGLPVHQAIATSLLSVIATSTAVAGVNVGRGTTNMRLGMTLEIATSLGAIAGGLTAALLAPRLLESVFALVLLPTAFVMWRRSSAEDGTASKTGPRLDRLAHVPVPTASAGENEPVDRTAEIGWLGGFYQEGSGVVTYRVERLWAGLAISFVAGNVSGLLGIGGGVFKVPALHLVCHMPMKAAAATSNFMIGVTAAASAFLYFGRGEVRPALTAAVILGVIGGSMVGTQLNQFLGGRFVKRLFAVLLVGVVVLMLYRAFELQG